MTVRPIRESDIPVLREMAESSGFPYPDLSHPHIEAALVVVDSEDRPIMACAAKRLVELYLYVDPSRASTVKFRAMNVMHSAMSKSLRELRYTSVEAFISPSIAEKFGRRLERTWGWVKNWTSFTIRL